MTKATINTQTTRLTSRLNHSPFWALVALGQSLVEGVDDLFSISIASTSTGLDSKTLDRYLGDGFMKDKSFAGYVMASGGDSIVHMISTSSLIYSVEFCLQSLADAGNMDSVISFPLPIDAVAALAILERAGMVNRFRTEMGSIQHERGRFAIEASGNDLYFKQLSKPVKRKAGSKKVDDFYTSVALFDRQQNEDFYHREAQYH